MQKILQEVIEFSRKNNLEYSIKYFGNEILSVDISVKDEFFINQSRIYVYCDTFLCNDIKVGILNSYIHIDTFDDFLAIFNRKEDIVKIQSKYRVLKTNLEFEQDKEIEQLLKGE